MTETIVVEYIGDGAFEQGIPARNLTADEWAEISTETQKRLIASGVYRKVKESKQKEVTNGN